MYNKQVLIYYSPFIEMRPGHMAWPIVNLYPHITKYFIKKGYNVLLICGTDLKNFAHLYDEKVQIHCIDHGTLLDFASSSTSFKSNSYFKESQFSNDQLAMSKVIKNILGKNFLPKWIFTYLNEVPFLKNLFPNAIIFRNEIGWNSSNYIYNLSFYFDTCGILESSSIFHYTNEIKNIDLSKNDEITIASFQTMMTVLYSILSPYQNWISGLRKQYKKILLFAGTVNYSYFHCYLTTDSVNFLDCIFRVAKSVPKDYAIIVTLHPGFDPREISDEIEEYINNKYPNVILKYNKNLIQSNTELLLVFCDGLIAGESKLFHEALIMKKPFFHIAITGYKNFSSGHINEVKDYFEINCNKNLSNYNQLIYWLLTHYFIYATDLLNETFMDNFLEKISLTSTPIKNYTVDESLQKLIKNDYLSYIKEYLSRFINPELVNEKDKLHQEVIHLRNYIHSLEEEKRITSCEKDTLNDEVMALRNSRSWKYTKTLRKLSDLIK